MFKRAYKDVGKYNRLKEASLSRVAIAKSLLAIAAALLASAVSIMSFDNFCFISSSTFALPAALDATDERETVPIRIGPERLLQCQC